MKLEKLIKYWPLVLGAITLIGFLYSISFKVDLANKKIDEVLAIIKEQTVQIANLDKRVTVLEATR